MVNDKTSVEIFSGNSHLDFASSIAKHLSLFLHGPDEADKKGKMITWFSNGNVLVDIKLNVRCRHCFVIQTQAPNVSDNIMELFWLINALKTSKAEHVTAVMPYMPYVRSDKKDHPRACIGAKLFAELLQTAGVDGVLIMDPHFQQVHGFFDEKSVRVDILKAKPIIIRFIKDSHDLANGVVVAPDINEAKHSGPMANMLGLPIAIIDKRRIGDDEKAKPFAMVGDVAGKDCFVFDDETASGGTLLETADFCVSKKARSVRCFVTHPVLSKLDGLREMAESDAFTQLVVTNTIPITEQKRNLFKGKLSVIDVSHNFADAIKIIANGESIDGYKKNLYQGL